MISRFFSYLLLLIIKVYQKGISPILPGRCRYYPTCSEYGKTAVLWHGPIRGGWLAIKRIARCHPLGGQGVDFVPLPLYNRFYKPFRLEPVSRETYLIERGIYKDRSSYVAIFNTQFVNHTKDNSNL